MKKFEYKVSSIKKGAFTSDAKYTEQFAVELNTQGIEGWELVEISGNIALEGYVIAVFKRETSK